MALPPNRIVAHYRIVSMLGAGGMGEVYLAEDTRLHRKVALKILPAELADNKDRMRRFEQEAQAAAALNHPNIATIHEIGEAEGLHFIAMEFIDGVTLGQVIHRQQAGLANLLRYLQQVAEGLAKAHASGIIHRDLKPDNIMITQDGYAKILDFGLAKLIEPQKPFGWDQANSSEVATAVMPQKSIPGVVMGTIGYMSPEQATGRIKEIDHRSDIFSFGCVLFEAATGRKAFAGKDALDSLHKIVHAPTPNLKDFNPLAPYDLERVARRCLAKEPAQRYQSIKEVAIELDELQQQLRNEARFGYSTQRGQMNPSLAKETAAPVNSSPSIAVLPFANLSPDRDNEYFCDGIAEELLNALARIDNLKVAARTSAFLFKGKSANVSEIGERLGVKAVLEGSVRKAGNRLRISVQLINTADGFHLWSERYDRELQDIFELQDEITLAVIDSLKVKLLGNARDAVFKRYTDNTRAYELFLKGRYHYFKYTAEGCKRAIDFFEKATEVDPSYAPAYAAMAATWGFLLFFGLVPSEAAIPPMKKTMAEALKLDEGLAETHLSSAMVNLFYDWEWRQAEEEFKRALELNPSNAEAFSFYSMFLALEGRFDEAIIQSKQSLAIDPLSPLINMNAGWTYFTAALLNEASDQVGKMVEIEPDFYGAYWLRGAIHLTGGNYKKAADDLKKAVSLGGHQVVVADLGSAYALAGRREEAESVLNQLLEKRRHEYVSAICIARVYCRLGETDKTIEWLEKALAERNGEMLFFQGEIEGAAEDDPLRELQNNPSVIAIFEKLNRRQDKP